MKFQPLAAVTFLERLVFPSGRITAAWVADERDPNVASAHFGARVVQLSAEGARPVYVPFERVKRLELEREVDAAPETTPPKGSKPQRCGKCGEAGHNRKRCPRRDE